MNCCNSYGQCTQGANCPARATPIKYLGDEEVDDFRYADVVRDFFAVIGAVAIAAAIAGFLSVFLKGIF
jgi:hypothetical protein